MTNVWSLPGFTAFLLLIICSSAYIRRVPALRRLMLAQKSGLPGSLYKCSVLGTRLHFQVAVGCAGLGLYLLFFQ